MMNYKNVAIILSIVFISFFSSAQTTLEVAENFTVKDTQGQLHELFTYLDNDKIVVISFSTTS